MAIRLRKAYRIFSIDNKTTSPADLPSVSVCIAARNEMHALAECLERVLKSDYKKMEIIVLDDNSDDKTSMIIRSFAHAGVRFVQGDELPEGWLGRNFAIDRLSREASGTFIVYLDVDTYIQPNTISQLVDYAVSHDLDMVSVVPGRLQRWRASNILGTLRYYEELLLANDSRPAVSASMWLLRRTTLLDEIGGMQNIANKVLLELALAVRLEGRYRNILNNSSLGVYFEKRLSTQYESARRILYPLLAGSSTFKIGLVMVIMLMVCLLPLLTIICFMTGYYILAISYLLLQVLFIVLYASYTRRTWQGNMWMLAAILWPMVVAQEMILLTQSFIGYWRHTITWKGRAITAKPKS